MSSNIGTTVIRDLGYNDYVHRVNLLGSMVVKAGFPENGEIAAPSDNLKEGIYDFVEMIVIASAHEFGLGVPERSFIRTAVDENVQKIIKTKELLFDRVALGKMTPEQAMDALGSFAVGLIKGRIVSGPFTPLKQSTIDAKGSSAPLQDSGQMKQTVQYVVTGK